MTIFKKRSVAMTSVHVRRMVISAMFLSIALVIRTLFRMYIPIFGESGMRISVHGIFSMMPAILFGPVYGAIVSGLTDFIGFHLRPTGAFIPQLTMTSILGGFIRGCLWMFFRDRSSGKMQVIVLVFALILLGAGLYTVDYIMIGAGAFGLALVVIDAVVNKWFMKGEVRTMPLLLALMIPAVIVSTLNTQILRHTAFPSWLLLPFTAVWLPRVVQTVATTTLTTYFIALLLGVLKKEPHLREWIKLK